MTTQCFPLIRGRALRATKLDACGNPVPGSRNQVVTKGVISVALTAQNDEGTTIQVTNANGDTCIRDVPAPRFLNWTLEISLCGVDPDLVELLTGEPTRKDADGNSVGFSKKSDTDVSAVAFSLELWSVVPGEECTDGVKSYGYILIPFIQGGVIGDFTWQNDAINFTVSGAQSKDGNGWGVGPYDVQLDESDDPGPLVDTVDPNSHLEVLAVKVPPPTTGTCGAQPFGTLATGATAGIPGEFTPSGSYAPPDLAGMSGVTASPLTAWTTGQYVTLEDGTLANWDSAAWAAGAA
jgi:hypothetical protein